MGTVPTPPSAVLILEDGTGVPNANAYTDQAFVTQYAFSRGQLINPQVSHIILATDFLEALTGEYKGRPTSYTQSLEWPRTIVPYNVFADPNSMFYNLRFSTPLFTYVDPNANLIPVELKKATAELCMAQIVDGIELRRNTVIDGGRVTMESMDGMVTQYAQNSSMNYAVLLPRVKTILAPLLTTGEIGRAHV